MVILSDRFNFEPKTPESVGAEDNLKTKPEPTPGIKP